MKVIEQFIAESWYSSAQTRTSLNLHIAHELSTTVFMLEEKKETREQKINLRDSRIHIIQWFS